MTAAMKTKQQGISLIEVAVALFILAVGFLGLASLQLMSLKNMEMAYRSNNGNSYLQKIAEAMRANASAIDEFIEGSGVVSSKNDVTCEAGCLFSVSAKSELNRIKNAIAQHFSKAVLTIKREDDILGSYGDADSDGRVHVVDIYSISLEWKEAGSFIRKSDSVKAQKQTLRIAIETIR